MDALITADDYRHALAAGEHEAFYFLFSTPDGQAFGFLRALFARDTVLEMVALRFGGRTWLHRLRSALPDDPPDVGDASGPTLRLTCQEPWQTWRCSFRSAVREVEGREIWPADLDLTFTALNAPGHYRFGPYRQAQQDGRLRGRIQIGAEVWSGELVCYRDHSWGQRPMGAAAGWTIAGAPGYFYIVIAETGPQPVHWGRLGLAGGEPRPPSAPQISAAGEGWHLEDPAAGMGTWQVQRLAPPLVAHLGPAGQEAIRDRMEPGDLYRDEIGPALFTSPQGDSIVGFLEQARRLS